MQRIDVSILERDYSLACPPDQRDALLAAVRHVDQRMRQIKASGALSSNERIAVMAAIQIAAELLATRTPDGVMGGIALGDFKDRIDSMNALLDQALQS